MIRGGRTPGALEGLGRSGRERGVVCRLVIAALVSFALATPALADLWYEHYDKGEKALKAQNWKVAVEELTQAIQKRGEPGVGVRTYGMNFVNYHPYLRLGIAYTNLGQFDAALQAFTTEETLGAIAKSPAELKILQDYRAKAQEGKQKGPDQEKQRIAGIVKKSLDEASDLEQAGQLDEAMVAVGRAIAVDPQNEEAQSALRRVRNRVETRERYLEDERRVASLVEEGKGLSAEGKYEEAASRFSQAVSLMDSHHGIFGYKRRYRFDTAKAAEVQDLLEQSQKKIREQLDAKTATAKRDAIAAGLAEASSMEKAGKIGEALQRLQSVLAIDGENRDAVAMRGRLLEQKTQLDGAKARTEEVTRLLSEGAASLEGGHLEASLNAFNRVIALDPQNASALESIGKVYTALKGKALQGQVVKLPPVISITDLRETDASGKVSEQVVASPDFVLTGIIFHSSPVLQVMFDNAGLHHDEPRISQRKVGDFFLHSFRQRFRLPPGVTTLHVVAQDQDDKDSKSVAEYQVRYDRPATQSPWLYAGLAAFAAISLGGYQGYRIHRRNQMLTRRFNPYIAGAPVLNDDLFVGREALLNRILQTIHNNSILLYGERRIGKTTLQHHLKKRLQNVKDAEYDFHPVFIDLQGTPQERFFQTLAEDIFGELATVLNGARPGIDPSGGAPYTHQNFMRDVRDVLKTLKQGSSKKVKLVLLIDEVDELNAYDPQVNQRLRSLFMRSFAEDMVAVVSGVGIKKHWESEGSPWYNFFEEIEVKPFTRKDAEQLIEKPIRGIFDLETGAVDRILEKTDCKPYLIQKLCIELVNRLHEEKRRRITIADVDALGRTAIIER